jgi:hypothetical protein
MIFTKKIQQRTDGSWTNFFDPFFFLEPQLYTETGLYTKIWELAGKCGYMLYW